MNTLKLVRAAIISAALAPTAGFAADTARPSQFAQSAAVDACIAFNNGEADLVKAVQDGVGDYLVWLDAGDDAYIACNANAKGDVFANVVVDVDLLDGEGGSAIQQVNLSDDPAEHAEALCLSVRDDTDVVSTTADGLGDYLVWLESDDGIFMCNASADAELWMFEAVDQPLGRDEAAATDHDSADTDTDTDWQSRPTPPSANLGVTPAA